MTEEKRLVSPEGYLGKLPTRALHADRRRNPKGPLMPFPVMPVDSKTWPSYPQLTFVYDNSFCGETEGDMVHLHGGKNCVLLPFAHTVAPEMQLQVWEMLQCFPGTLCSALRSSHARLL